MISNVITRLYSDFDMCCISVRLGCKEPLEMSRTCHYETGYEKTDTNLSL